jgi:hypothetical protein
MSFIAYHGSRYGDCALSERRAAFFTLDKQVAFEFGRLHYPPTICTVAIPFSWQDIYDASRDPSLRECLAESGLPGYHIRGLLSSIDNYDWKSFDPNSWPGSIVAKCIQDMGFRGWIEREDADAAPVNFGVFDPRDIQVVQVEQLCPECRDSMVTLVRTESGNVRCPICSTVDLCPKCLTETEWDDDAHRWDFPCWHPED